MSITITKQLIKFKNLVMMKNINFVTGYVMRYLKHPLDLIWNLFYVTLLLLICSSVIYTLIYAFLETCCYYIL